MVQIKLGCRKLLTLMTVWARKMVQVQIRLEMLLTVLMELPFCNSLCESGATSEFLIRTMCYLA